METEETLRARLLNDMYSAFLHTVYGAETPIVQTLRKLYNEPFSEEWEKETIEILKIAEEAIDEQVEHCLYAIE